MASAAGLFGPFQEREQHRHALTVLAVGIAEEGDEITLFELNGDEDVACGGNGEQQVAERHPGSGPEGDHKTQIEWMADVLVEGGRLETNGSGMLAAEVEADLPQPKKVGVAEQGRATQNGEPAKHAEPEKDPPAGGVFYVPDDAGHGPPLPEEQDEKQTGQQHIGAALDGMGNQLRPPPLEPLPCHHAVLDGEKPQEERVDQKRREGELTTAGIDRLRNENVGDKTDCVKESQKEDEVRDDPVEKRCDPGHLGASSLLELHICERSRTSPGPTTDSWFEGVKPRI